MEKKDFAKIALIVIASLAAVLLISFLAESIYYLVASGDKIYGNVVDPIFSGYLIQLGVFGLVVGALFIAFIVVTYLYIKKPSNAMKIASLVMMSVTVVIALVSAVILGFTTKIDHGGYNLHYFTLNHYFSMLISFLTLAAFAVAMFVLATKAFEIVKPKEFDGHLRFNQGNLVSQLKDIANKNDL